MTSFATTAELADYLKREIPVGKQASAQLILNGATAAIRNEADQHLSKVTNDEVTLDGSGLGVLLLPEVPVTAVGSVVIVGKNGNDNETLTIEEDYDFSEKGILYRLNGRSWPAQPRKVRVTYTHGYDSIPDDIKTVCIQAAARTYVNPEGLVQEGIGQYNVTYTGTGRGLTMGVTLNEGEKRILDRYKI